MKGTASGGTKKEDVPVTDSPPQSHVESGRAHHHNVLAVQIGHAPAPCVPGVRLVQGP
jgi:hypothetical protein